MSVWAALSMVPGSPQGWRGPVEPSPQELLIAETYISRENCLSFLLWLDTTRLFDAKHTVGVSMLISIIRLSTAANQRLNICGKNNLFVLKSVWNELRHAVSYAEKVKTKARCWFLARIHDEKPGVPVFWRNETEWMILKSTCSWSRFHISLLILPYWIKIILPSLKRCIIYFSVFHTENSELLLDFDGSDEHSFLKNKVKKSTSHLCIISWNFCFSFTSLYNDVKCISCCYS